MAVTRAWWGDLWQTGSVAAASPVSARAWQRQPPQSSLAAVAAGAGLRHPGGAAEAGEGGRVGPDVGEGGIGDGGERHSGDRRCRVAGQHPAGGIDVDKVSAPAAHAGLRQPGVIIGDDIIDDEAAGMRSPAPPRRRRSPLAVGPARQQRGPVDERPAVVLDVGDLDASGAERQRECDHALDAGGFAAVDDGVDGQRQPCGGDRLRGGELLCMRALRGRRCARRAAESVSWKLSWTWSRPASARRAASASPQQHARGDQVGVEAGRGRRPHQVRKVRSRRRLAAGEAAPAGRRASAASRQHPLPFRRRKLAARRLQRQRVGAVDAAHRAAMRDLGEERQGRRNGRRRCSSCDHALRPQIVDQRQHVRGDLARSRPSKVSARSADDGGDGAAVQAPDDLVGDLVEDEDALAAPAAPSGRGGHRGCSLTPRRQPRPFALPVALGMGRAAAPAPSSSALRPEGAGRHQPRLHIGKVEGIELRPQHLALEAQRVLDDGAAVRSVRACALT